MIYMKFKGLFISLFVFVIALTMIVYDSTHGALTRLGVKRITLSSEKIPSVFNALNLIYFTDLQSFTLNEKYYTQVMKEIQALNPDFVVFGGDLIDEASYASYSEAERTFLIDALKNIKAPYGKYAILSQTDQAHQTELQSIYLEAGFEILNTKLIPIHVLGEATINFLGWDETSDPNLLSSILPTEYTLAFAHDPALSNQLNTAQIDVLVCGKTHGGQITLPFIGPLTMRSEIHQNGKYELSDLTLYVSSGIGVSDLKARWMTDPSFILFTFKSN